ncbi:MULTISPECIES: YtoQ family protein [Thermoactinomyces]|jgi:YtoQ family protein|uniref:YtoQ family protein n=1 Tax=Thermoactinomyces daqus TaxID=1329516 RepID=A0A7W2AIB7_9BACL|nr:MULTISPECIES: YtoQ family protein [Thermoactinomyces]MBA4543631.1 YtoQ family protein [Thermoactinomyces daqus]MBH8597082.1 YtoQ family protein [Thermoactinomyces sp. CICC 10523]MBH8602642.1 YtoQ family protein [Thermoactinomyces sp. CICC 10522]MBH8606247.1 YtoQ family protein [Thermoactinomyces sp. CICC 10521]
MELVVYLAGQIHDDWRDKLRQMAKERNLPLIFKGPQEDHDLSDDIGERIKGKQPNAVYRDQAASEVNNLRTRIWMQKADVVIALFGEKYRQWNTAMDAAMAIAAQKPLILIRPESLHHPLKELSQRAQLVVETPEQALDALAYVLE